MLKSVMMLDISFICFTRRFRIRIFLFTLKFSVFVQFAADIDECRTGKHLCDQLCHNTFGSYSCSCIAGYKLDADDRTCDGKGLR